MAVTFYFIVPDFETGYSSFYFWHNIGENNIAYDHLIEKCGNQLQQTRGKIIHFFTKLLIFFFLTFQPPAYFLDLRNNVA